MSSTPRKVESQPTRPRSLVTKSSLSSLPSPVSEPQPLTLPFAPGDVIADKYEVVGVLGSGGVAYVISALHLELGEMVALKFLRPESLAHEDVVARFASEARAVARIKSEHVAHVFDVGTLPDGAPFIVMEYLEGKDLADVLAERRKLPVKVAVDYVLQACEALACAHAAGIVHRDIKPENLFLTQQAGSVERVKVLDFGISKNALAGFEAPNGKRFAHTMLPMGTPGYMSPEQIRACGAVDARTDIWALGCVLFELVTGLSAFTGPTLLQLGAAILERDPVPLRQVVSDASPELEALITKCLQKDPDLRFQDVAELAAALYPFGPRRSRVSAERCHQILKGQSGVVIEFNSVPPPGPNGASLPPVSSTGPTVNAVPLAVSVPALEPLRTSTPASPSFVGFPAEKKPASRAFVAAAVGVSLLAGVVLALVLSRRDAPAPQAAAAPAAAPTLQAATAAPQPTPAKAGQNTVANAASAPSDVAPSDAAASAAPGARLHVKPGRAQRVAVAPPPARHDEPPAPSAKPKPAKRGLDDSEPDVGY